MDAAGAGTEGAVVVEADEWTSMQPSDWHKGCREEERGKRCILRLSARPADAAAAAILHEEKEN